MRNRRVCKSTINVKRELLNLLLCAGAGGVMIADIIANTCIRNSSAAQSALRVLKYRHKFEITSTAIRFGMTRRAIYHLVESQHERARTISDLELGFGDAIDARAEKIKKAISDGLDIYAIASLLDISSNTVATICKEYNLKPVKRAERCLCAGFRIRELDRLSIYRPLPKSLK